MVPQSVEVIGVGILAVMILKEVFAFIKAFINNRNGNSKTKIDLHDIKQTVDELQGDMTEIKNQIKDLWVWHEKEEPGEPGVKVWYANRKRTEDALVKIAESLDRLVDLTGNMQNDIRELRNASYSQIQSRSKPTRKKKS